MDVQRSVKVQIVWKSGSNLMRLCVRYLRVKYWGRHVKGEEREINSGCRTSFMVAFYSFLHSILWARFPARH